MLIQGFSSQPTAAERAVLDSISRVVVEHLDDWRRRRSAAHADVPSPVLIHIDGPGRTLFLDNVAERLDPKPAGAHAARGNEWSVIRFDAWQYQRVAPPWWWLIKAIDRGLRQRVRRRGWWQLQRRLARDYAWRTGELLRDLAVVIPVIAVAAVVAGVAWRLSGQHEIAKILQWATTVIAGLTAITGLGWSLLNAVRRHLLVASPAGARAVLQTSDPMADLKRRYEWLVKSAGTSVAVLIDNLDRCRAEYVVELLEGVQTLFRDDDPEQELPMVVYLVAADRAWLCDSYVDAYAEFKASTNEPGRPFGLSFLDKVFDLQLRIPTVPAAMSWRARDGDFPPAAVAARRLVDARSELEVRDQLVALEAELRDSYGSAAVPSQELRREAVLRLAHLEQHKEPDERLETEAQLEQLAARAEPGPATVRQLTVAYCVQRTELLLAGHEIDHDDAAIQRLGLWTIVLLRWPLLADRIRRRPEELANLRDGLAPDDAGPELALLFAQEDSRRIGELAEDLGLDSAAIRRFTTPLDVLDDQRAAAAVPAVRRSQAPTASATRLRPR